ncbi:MAG: formylglycine-generating enzyme family protein, partial [bacterium]|nr:formylglycine-generating enzyme family protein [bacterium]
WEKAARGVDGRNYPWGNQFEAGRLNAREGKQVVRTTTPVGIYPTGTSPFGIFDCAGNVWEWNSTVWKAEAYPFKIQPEWTAEYLNRTGFARVLRGGSWYHGRDFARCSYRNSHFPRYRLLNYGFRVLAAPISEF